MGYNIREWTMQNLKKAAFKILKWYEQTISI